MTAFFQDVEVPQILESIFNPSFLGRKNLFRENTAPRWHGDIAG
jgi:hypothetical protein